MSVNLTILKQGPKEIREHILLYYTICVRPLVLHLGLGLGLVRNNLTLAPQDVTLAQKLLFIAQSCILLNWIEDKPPSIH